MRKLTIMEHVSLDGVVQLSAEDGFPYVDWTTPYRSPEGFAQTLAALGDGFDLLLGRRTYDIWSGYWPKAEKGPMSDRLNAATKYVVTHRPESLTWGPFGVVGPDLVAGVGALRATPGPNLILWGSSTLTSLLLEAGLADELRLNVYPVLLGKGKRFFEKVAARSLTLESTTCLPSGIVTSLYKFGGPLKN